jgi:hypothetical protein
MSELNSQEGHHKYLNNYGQPKAHLLQTHSLGEKCDNLKSSHIIIGLAIAMLCIPLTVLKCLESIYVDGLISGVDIRKFTDDFSAQAKAQATMVSVMSHTQMRTLSICQASVIMAVDASILAIPGSGSQLATRVLCSVSFILSVYCIIGCMIAQQFSSRIRSLDLRFIPLLFLQPGSYILDKIGVLPPRENDQFCNTCKHTKCSVSSKVSNL